MDIEEMKKNWDALNARLDKSETINREAVRKILSHKAFGGYDKIRNQEKRSLYSSLFLMVMFPLMYVQGVIPYWYSMALMELFVVGSLVYTICLLRAMPKSDQYRNGVVGLMKSTAKYQKLYTCYAPVLISAIVITLFLFFCSVGKGFPDDSYHQAILIGVIIFVTVCGITGYRKTKERLDEIHDNLMELSKFEAE